MADTGGVGFGKLVAGVGCGIVLALAAILGACSMCVGKVAIDTAQKIDEDKQQKKLTLRAVDITDLESERDGEWIKIRGRVHNGSASPVTFVKVEAEFLDRHDTVIDTDWTYAVASDALAPGASKSFEIMQRAGRKASNYRVHVMNE